MKKKTADIKEYKRQYYIKNKEKYDEKYKIKKGLKSPLKKDSELI